MHSAKNFTFGLVRHGIFKPGNKTTPSNPFKIIKYSFALTILLTL